MTTTIDSATQRRTAHAPGEKLQGGLLDPALLLKALPDALRKLDPRTLWRNPVMFIVEIGAVWSTVLAIGDDSWFSWLSFFGFGRSQLPQVVIGPGAIVKGKLRFRQEVKLYVSDQATIDPVEGATVTKFSGAHP